MFWNILHKELRIPANLSPQAQGLEILSVLNDSPALPSTAALAVVEVQSNHCYVFLKV
jgi:hypothetical protein